MAPDWRGTLRTLLTQFEARAAQSRGLNHLFVEVADCDRSKLSGPKWFTPFPSKIEVVDGQPQFDKWDTSASRGLPGISPAFREPASNETFDNVDSQSAMRDRSGVVRAVATPVKLRQGFYCGARSEEVIGFESLANAAAAALAGSKELHEHVFASDLKDIFRIPRGGIRYVFGEIPTAPKEFISQGWRAGILQFEQGDCAMLGNLR